MCSVPPMDIKLKPTLQVWISDQEYSLEELASSFNIKQILWYFSILAVGQWNSGKMYDTFTFLLPKPTARNETGTSALACSHWMAKKMLKEAPLKILGKNKDGSFAISSAGIYRTEID